MLSYTQVLPHALPDFYNYLLNYPDDQPANAEDSFYWDSAKFGLNLAFEERPTEARHDRTPQHRNQ